MLGDSCDIEAAQVGDSALGGLKEGEGEHYGYRFITSVRGDDGRFWELNGGMKGPVARGWLRDGEDALSVLGDGARFSLVVLAPKEV